MGNDEVNNIDLIPRILHQAWCKQALSTTDLRTREEGTWTKIEAVDEEEIFFSKYLWEFFKNTHSPFLPVKLKHVLTCTYEGCKY